MASESLKGNNLISIEELSASQIIDVLDLADALKEKRNAGKSEALLAGKSLVMLFEKASTRTRVSFEVAMTELGGHALYVDLQTSQMGRGETIEDTAKTLSGYAHGIMARLYSHEAMKELAKYASVPVISGLDNVEHPCQVLADLQTIREHKKKLNGLKVAFVGDGENNVTHSLLLACSKLGISISVGCPKGYEPLPEILERSKAYAKRNNGFVEVTKNANDAVKNADVVIADTWVSMGDEKEKEKRLTDLKPFCVDNALMKAANEKGIFMHCLPAHRGQEVTAEVIDGEQSVVWDEAENRLHAQKALLALLIK